jgi:uncharacterized protein YggE
MAKNFKLGLIALALAIVTFLGVKFFGTSLVQADTLAQQAPTPRQITVIGQGSVSASPDIARANLGVQVTASTVTEATQQNNKTMDAVLAQLKAAGIAAKDIQTSNYNIYPQRNNPGPNGPGEVTGYQVTNMVQITIRNLNQVGQILDQAIQAGANNVDNISFDFSDPAQLQLQALDRAIADAQSRADQLAKSSGVQRGEVLSMSEIISSGPGPQPRIMAAQLESSAVPIQAGSSEVQAQVQVVYAIQAGP